MYTRPVSAPPERIIKNGAPVFGFFAEPFKQLDIRDIARPYGALLLPKCVTNLRIRANMAFSFSTAEYTGTIEIFDSKVFGFVEFIIFENKSGKKYAYRKVMGLHRRIVPKSTEAAVCLTFSRRRYARISWSQRGQKLTALFNIKGDGARPAVSAALSVDMAAEGFARAASVVPAKVSRRCTASVQMCGPASGSVALAGVSAPAQAGSACAFLDLRRSYYPLRTASTALTGLGFVGGRQLSFRISQSNLDGADAEKYNGNVLFVDGKAWPLPPVKITQPKGIAGTWVVQDTESMVDLAFTPRADTRRALSLLFLHTDCHTVLGEFEGTLLSGAGEAFSLKAFSGIGKKMRLRY